MPGVFSGFSMFLDIFFLKSLAPRYGAYQQGGGVQLTSEDVTLPVPPPLATEPEYWILAAA